MADPNHQHEEFTVPDFAHDPVGTHPNTPQPVELALEGGTDVRIRCRSIDLFDEQPAGSSVDGRKLRGSARSLRAYVRPVAWGRWRASGSQGMRWG
jgi:hypothetical protein